MTARNRTDVLLLAGFCVFLFFYGIAQFGLIGADEPRYAQVAREMLERRDWITPMLGGHAWLEKPPLYYWQAMLVYSVLGVSDAAARIPSAIDATLLIVVIYLLFRAVALPWYVAGQVRHPQFFREFMLEHNLARFSTNLYHHPVPFWYYIPVILLALVPWIVFVIVAIAESIRVWWAERGSVPDLELQFRIFACCWLIVPLLFFSISRSKLPGYILPAVPAGVVLLSDYLRQQLEQQAPLPKWMAILHALITCAPIVPAVLMSYIVTQHS